MLVFISAVIQMLNKDFLMHQPNINPKVTNPNFIASAGSFLLFHVVQKAYIGNYTIVSCIDLQGQARFL